MSKKIVLLGYMGSGKSTVGRLLSDRLNIPFIDLDDYIESELGMSIPEIFSKKGEVFFRKKEHELLAEVLGSDRDYVLALGGGTPCYIGNMEIILSATPHVFYLRTDIQSLAERLLDEKSERPLISHLPDEEIPEFIGKHLFERTPFYHMAHHIIDAASLPAEEVAKLVLEKLS